MKQTNINLRLTLDVEYNPAGETVETLKHLLEGVVSHAADEGLLTGETPATVKKWSHKVAVLGTTQ
jgi:hypothetical protein